MRSWGAGASALFLKVVNSGVPGRRPCRSFRRAGHRAASLRRSDWEIAHFHALRRSPRAGRASRGAAPWKDGLIVSTLRFIDRWRGGLARAQSWRASLLNCPRIAAYRGKICSHGRRLLRPSGIMLPQKCRAARPDFPRTAMACIAGVREDLCGRLSAVEVRLGSRRRNRRADGGCHDNA